MNNILLLKTSFRSLKQHKGRSILTILGIIVGIASIISTLAIGYGAEEKLKQKILGMGNNYIFVHAGKFGGEGKTTLTQRKGPTKLTLRDEDIFKNQCPLIKKITPSMFSRQIISFETNNVLADMKCGNQNYLNIIERKIKKGSFFTKQQIQKNCKVVVIGSKTAEILFKKTNPIGKSVKINNKFFIVIGMVKKVESYFGLDNPNLDIYIPITTAKKHILCDNSSQVHGIAISAKEKKDMPFIVKKLKKILRFKHHLKKDEPDDFTIFDQQAMVKAAKSSSNILSILLLIIASISLIVGGIGVMNIMLVSVSERTKEIGIRMALGATNIIILKQFILESIVLCFTGGIIGILIGIIVPHIVSLFTQWIVVIKFSSIFFAFFITFMVGLIFGFYPAQKASKLNPIQALQDI